ncbi:unnamed protein product [Ectocarpus sp. CCAP 1310/34]|nr:unnamed protein product [Ectocarpus sp. CCAP 1310/34]
MNGKELKRKLERDTGINVAHRTANRMKMTARDGDKATTAAGYQLLGSFCDLLQQQCPGSVAETQVLCVDAGHLKGDWNGMMLVATSKDADTKLVLCVDAGHLKGDWNGMMLVATGTDADTKLVHVATSICDKENTDNYSWFYLMMKNNVDMAEVLNSPKTTLFTDKHKSHEPAITLHAPNTVWRWCLRHHIKALPEAPGQTVTHWLYHAARAPTRTKFMDTKVKPTKPKAYAALLDPNKPHELVKWTHHAGPTDTAIGGVVSSNAAEQNMVMVGLQRGEEVAALHMAQHILDKTASRMAERAELVNSASQRFTPFAAKEFEAQRAKSSNLHSSATGNGNFTVRKLGSNYGNRVGLEFGTDGVVTRMTCTCGY